MAQGSVPLSQIRKRRVDSAIAERCRGGALIGFLPRAILFGVAVGSVSYVVLASLVGDCVIHAQCSEDAVVQKVTERFPRNLLYNLAEDNVTRVAVVPPGTGSKFRALLFFEKINSLRVLNLRDSFLLCAAIRLRHQVLVVEKAGSMVQKIADGDRIPIRLEIR